MLVLVRIYLISMALTYLEFGAIRLRYLCDDENRSIKNYFNFYTIGGTEISILFEISIIEQETPTVHALLCLQISAM